VANLVPLAGVIFGKWSCFDVVFLFWLENVIVGFFNVAKILTTAQLASVKKIWAGNKPAPDGDWGIPAGRAASIAGGMFYALFFAFHFGFFLLVHGFFIFILLGGPGVHAVFFADLVHQAREAITGPFAIAFWSLFLSHGFSFVYNFLYRKEYERVSMPALMAAPYGRIVIMHLAIIFGAVFVQRLPQFMVALLVVLKTGMDLAFHLKERQTGVVGLLRPTVG
jgi:hypothetical protein